MHTPMHWDDLRYFLELARAHRLTRAARKLSVDYTTVARRIKHLETALRGPSAPGLEAGRDGGGAAPRRDGQRQGF